MTGTRRLRSLLGWVLVGIVCVLAWPAALGGSLSLVVVAGHSMDGTYRSGDLLLVGPEPAYDTGDVIVYRVPDGEPASGLRVVHRVIGDDHGRFTTQGDNRDSPDIWTPTAADIDGRPFLRIPAGGYALRWFLSPIALALACAVCIYLVVVGKDDGEADDGEGEAEPGADEASRPELVLAG